MRLTWSWLQYTLSPSEIRQDEEPKSSNRKKIVPLLYSQTGQDLRRDCRFLHGSWGTSRIFTWGLNPQRSSMVHSALSPVSLLQKPEFRESFPKTHTELAGVARPYSWALLEVPTLSSSSGPSCTILPSISCPSLSSLRDWRGCATRSPGALPYSG